MTTKAFEIRDVGTFIPVIATRMVPGCSNEQTHERERYLLARSGFGFAEPLVMLCRMDANGLSHQASYDPYGWGCARTMGVAQTYIAAHWPDLKSGDVIDVEFVLGEKPTPKVSEAHEDLAGGPRLGNTPSADPATPGA